MEYIKNNKKWIFVLISLFIVVTFGYYFFADRSEKIEMINGDHELNSISQKNEETFEQKMGENDVSDQEPNVIIVDIKGAIYKPGVYEIEADARVHQLIEKAGGLNSDADEIAINLAAPLQDGMVLYIPKKGETEVNPYTSQEAGLDNDQVQKVNINTATIEELQTLTGIGPAKAEAIMTYREENGLFQSPEDLLEVTGIGEKSYEKLKEEILVK
ncbi:competence protein ComEA [Metabacillus crassostreae]|uniref:helix-hairpin-helix domain-containing protein n=1 Tax=Metabacillus crassostreae TaxID=929098 RepID=UPI00195C0CF6|nr:helix-hairpin-helix domain-containing protein [Metabacillus crassostreae]MBM7604768.1 competence protein ComEA [Metabacillus crassostreae]